MLIMILMVVLMIDIFYHNNDWYSDCFSGDSFDCGGDDYDYDDGWFLIMIMVLMMTYVVQRLLKYFASLFRLCICWNAAQSSLPDKKNRGTDKGMPYISSIEYDLFLMCVGKLELEVEHHFAEEEKVKKL